ncbi:MAG: hypothetical protein A3J79_10235 [Elusimicrobia bacterium RIFOXYB2_FULL_62_6]|nr:MAG: hypothetical protein A3J79_10235 [Elusimicrobia bacterium RIFOXYB2_FULL_62_6]
MTKIKTALLNIALSLSLVNFVCAAAPAANENAGAPAFDLQFSAESLAAIAVPELTPAPQPEEAVRAIQPGNDLTPKVEDQKRIKAILKLVSDVYNNVHLPYSQDGSTFKNKEGKLPQKPAGFYKEYTLLTGDAPHTVVIGGQTYQVAPDLSARGSERVIIGGGEFLYYTPDHYAHFILLTVVR